MENRPIMIQGAMDVECAYFLARMDDKKETVIDGYHYWEGTFAGKKVVIAKTYMASVNAAVSTAFGIREFAPGAIINQGIAGAHRADLKVGDIVVAERMQNIAAFQTGRVGEGEGVCMEKWAPLGLEVRGELTADNCFAADGKLLAAARKAADGRADIYFGTISSADTWNREHDRILYANRVHGSLAEEMESSAASQVALGYGIGVLGVRAISNNELGDGEFFPEVAEKCSAFVEKILLEL
ncbi:MAG: 5'-methylthioadenosine/S-adenosylhomocysteine nucleosidase [Christensenellaceae bacterium]|nr:5'-methylthioadenosine/S-adenosylhomocysteine nucleosidase [Christensenellaceae bacterium]